MALFGWNDIYSVNVVEIDRQHKKLIELMNELHNAMLKGQTKDILGRVIEELIAYTSYHFATEEKYFDQFDYPETTTHKNEHNDFIKKITDFKQDFGEGRLFLSTHIMNFLKDWLINHIQGSDKKYSSLFNEKGLE